MLAPNYSSCGTPPPVVPRGPTPVVEGSAGALCLGERALRSEWAPGLGTSSSCRIRPGKRPFLWGLWGLCLLYFLEGFCLGSGLQSPFWGCGGGLWKDIRPWVAGPLLLSLWGLEARPGCCGGRGALPGQAFTSVDGVSPLGLTVTMPEVPGWRAGLLPQRE